jgi:hypothetical protein
VSGEAVSIKTALQEKSKTDTNVAKKVFIEVLFGFWRRY